MYSEKFAYGGVRDLLRDVLLRDLELLMFTYRYSYINYLTLICLIKLLYYRLFLQLPISTVS